MVRLGSLERLGVPFALHSDCPMAPLSPLTLAATAVNRVTINGNLNAPTERVSLDAALRAITIDAAWVIGEENDIGSIRAGKRADFLVLDVPNVAHLAYEFGRNPVVSVIKDGAVALEPPANRRGC